MSAATVATLLPASQYVAFGVGHRLTNTGSSYAKGASCQGTKAVANFNLLAADRRLHHLRAGGLLAAKLHWCLGKALANTARQPKRRLAARSAGQIYWMPSAGHPPYWLRAWLPYWIQGRALAAAFRRLSIGRGSAGRKGRIVSSLRSLPFG